MSSYSWFNKLVLHRPVESGVHTSKDYVKLCARYGVKQSTQAIGSSADNALAESLNAALKRELLEGREAFPDAATAYRAVFRWANRYNTRRRHSAIGNVAPSVYEVGFTVRLATAA
ncbi:integrase core domain-containing protein [Leucobacter sp. W1153]|uniref:integrase core domain-containing protein n=1 Tax=Leucobacter sp. W1153 TaxID=3439064 RepID=UPI003F40822F